ncbi:cysteine--tRNA ligase [Lactobacillus crispatus]|uniref:Cysteine--tRNA ligase n=1 Tax=Lactobacillus crispatus TaxID=47770 RepID=A0A5M9Z4B9_9LACO|nr:cysteine--tRNA ligase [Lactobacillus crispatus]KAA8801313.1 cysteine--tRNA ligase [Lactobacillus crispatus]KAA8813151.1 cysteine--tRNA ligase [Lactobacillus crispatus]KRK34092.1 cysteinyl-tRNA synthetase [Lactobacillus crispatus DSM 20584 = JCM 1185 = ATCC 33820]MBW9143131.1 cysteine--tRNA ligase [Lactobacillus crispatus]ORE85706.1 cysteine--tRNA ligase [Lactobacillus crispatus]
MLAVRVYNTLTRKKEEFKPLVPGHISMYVCGPTVYNYIHIGNARSAIAFDTIRRYFEYKGYDVKYVSNFTDVDDKMINEARAEKTTVPKLAEKFINAFLADTTALNIETATLHPRATHEINDIITFVKSLIDNGYAYEVDGDVYYRAKKFKHYGQLSDQNIEQLEEGASEHINDTEQSRKEDPIDFALWKAQKEPDEIAWDSPWGKGRPGWHIECSVMSTKYLGDTIDIHGGGQDLEFPHHENEIAQSEAKTGKKFVNYWLHNGFVTVGKDQEKMSKSLHNFVTVHDILREVDPQVLRFFMASVQYRRQINYSAENLAQAATILDRFKNTLTNINYRLADDTASEESAELAQAIMATNEKFEQAMDDDFNVQNALTAIYDLLPVVNANANAARADKQELQKFKEKLASWLLVFGVDTNKLCVKNAGSNDDEIDALVKKRDEARANKDWATSDQIRDQLKEMGITIQDTPQGTRWTRD